MLYPAELQGRAIQDNGTGTTNGGVAAGRHTVGPAGSCAPFPRSLLSNLEAKCAKVACMTPVEDPESDLTRKERREQAREQRRVAEQAVAAQSAQRKRLIQLGGVAGVVIVIIAIILVATGSGSKKVVAPKSPEANQAVAAVTSLLQGIPQNGSTLGNPKAKVTLQYFGDLECPICREFTLGALPPLIEKYVRTGALKIEYRSLETATREPETFQTQQIAALAAGKQKLMWHYVELFYHEQGQEDSGYVTESYLQGLASQVPGLNLSTWTSDRNNSAFPNQITADAQAANQAAFTGTPSFLIGKTGGATEPITSPSLTNPSDLEKAIEKQLKA
jgi:protein-disulfide isomerase